MNLVKIISTEIDSLNRRIVKFLRLGKSDTQTSFQSSAYGTDSNPVKDMIAVYAKTGVKGKTVIVGYINKNQLAAIGEHRIFSTDSDGTLSTFIWLKNDGTMEIGGDTDFMVRYSALETAYNELQDDLTTLKNAISGWVPVVNDGGAALKAALTSWFGTPLTSDIADAKIEEIKTI